MKPTYITDDPHSMLVIIEYGKLKGWMKQIACRNPECSEKIHYDFDETKSLQRIAEGIADGYFKLHVELGEWYYHPTDAGLELLKCLGCKSELFSEHDLLHGVQK